MALELSHLEVLVVDCQATQAAPRGALLELGWATSVAGGCGAVASRLVKLPEGERVPPAVTRITGISAQMAATGVTPQEAWGELVEKTARHFLGPAPTVAHFAKFERPFLERLGGGAFPGDWVCTHELALRLLPGLPRRGLRALTGYFGRSVPALRRSAEHVEATAFVWGELVRLLGDAGVLTWSDLLSFLSAPVSRARRARHLFPMPRDLRLALPERPGVYRMLRTSGDVLYVGKATSLRHRVNSYFRKHRGVHERTLEMLSQARGLSFEVTESALESALLEADEIKRLCPPYNVALTLGERAVWFASRALTRWERGSSAEYSIGPFPAVELLIHLEAFAREDSAALGRGAWGPPHRVWEEGLARLKARHPEVHPLGRGSGAHLLRLGGRLWREGRRDRDEDDEAERPTEWTAEVVQASLERLALRGALAVRRARWLTRLSESSVTWWERGNEEARHLSIEGGELVGVRWVPVASEPPVPARWALSTAARQAGFSVVRLDRLRVLTTELKRVVAEGQAVSLRLGPRPPFTGAELARILEWV